MGDCRYCGKSAGFLRKEHKECAAAHEEGLDSIRKVCVEAALHGVDVNRLSDRVRSIGAAAYIDTSEGAMAATLAQGWGHAVKAAMDDHFLSNEEKRGLNRYRARYNLKRPPSRRRRALYAVQDDEPAQHAERTRRCAALGPARGAAAVQPYEE